MKCPNCSYSDFTFYPEDHIAYFDQYFNSWAEAMVYTCPECGYSEFMRQPQGTVLDNMGVIPPQISQALAPVFGDDVVPGRSWIDNVCAAQHSVEKGNFAEAAIYAHTFCLQKRDILDIIWIAWALSLAEKSGLLTVLDNVRRMYVAKCREYRREYINRSSFAYKGELLSILDREIARLAPPDRAYEYR